MGNTKPTFILYYYVHIKVIERFGVDKIYLIDDVANFIANRFRCPRQI